MQCESLYQQPDTFDQDLDQLTQLVWQLGYCRDIMKNKIKEGVSTLFQRLSAPVIDVPQDLHLDIDKLRKLRQREKQSTAYEQNHSAHSGRLHTHTHRSIKHQTLQAVAQGSN